MAKKSLILSNDDGRVTFTNTASISLEDSSFSINTNAISASTLQINDLANNTSRLLKINSNGTASIFNNNTVGNSALVWDGSSWNNSTAVISTRYTGSTGGQISGNIDSNISVLSVANVNSGTLGTNYGGTGLSLPTNSNAILEVSKSIGGSVTYSMVTGSNGQVLTVQNSGYLFKFPVNYPDVRFYTSSASPAGGQTTFTWTKPANAKFARIILQGAGGGGGGGGTHSTTPYGGGGGASGGYTDVTISVFDITSATVRVGIGGSGGVGGTTTTATAGGTGGTTLFDNATIIYTATGGGGGARGANLTTKSAPGTGLTSNGGAGAAPNTNVTADTTNSMPSGGGKGQGATALTSGGTITNIISNKNYGYTLDAFGREISVPIASGSSGIAYSLNPLYTVPGYGAGGGGGGATITAGQHTNGIAGGNGYAIIISW